MLPKFFRKLNALANEELKCAMDTGHEAVVKLLVVRNDVDVNIEASNQKPLSWAAMNGYDAVVKLLLETDKSRCGLEGL